MVSVVWKEDISGNTTTHVPEIIAPSPPHDKQQPTNNEHDFATSEHESSDGDWVDAEVEYVGLDDELVGESFEDDLVVDDTLGCETIVHVTDYENPKIEVGVTFEDGACFKRCIRQYAVMGEYKTAAPYCEGNKVQRLL